MATSNAANLRKLEERGRDGPRQKSVLICWDLENARVPVGVPPEEVERAISNAFQYLQRRVRFGFVCSVSPRSLDALTKAYGEEQRDYLLTHTEHILAPGGQKSGSTDNKLLQKVMQFVSQQRLEGKATSSVLVLITGDDDFSGCIRQAMDSGMDVEVLHPTSKTSANLLDTIRGRANVWHHDWDEFLDYWLTEHAQLPKDAKGSSGKGSGGTAKAGAGAGAGSKGSGGDAKAGAGAGAGSKGSGGDAKAGGGGGAGSKGSGGDAKAGGGGGAGSKGSGGDAKAGGGGGAGSKGSGGDTKAGGGAGAGSKGSGGGDSKAGGGGGAGSKGSGGGDSKAGGGGGAGSKGSGGGDSKAGGGGGAGSKGSGGDAKAGGGGGAGSKGSGGDAKAGGGGGAGSKGSGGGDSKAGGGGGAGSKGSGGGDSKAGGGGGAGSKGSGGDTKAGGKAGGKGDSSGNTGKGAPAAFNATISLGSVPCVRKAQNPGYALMHCCAFLSDLRQNNDEDYQYLHTVARDAGCKLVVPKDLGPATELTVSCVDDDELLPRRAVQSARDRLLNALDELLGPVRRAAPDELMHVLAALGLNTTSYAHHSEDQLRGIANACAYALKCMGGPMVVVNGTVVGVRTGAAAAALKCSRELQLAAVRDVLAKEFATGQLLHVIRQMGPVAAVAAAGAVEKKDLAALLAAVLMECYPQPVWEQ
ncbi:hypothetical protein HYH03_015070 [Edaphochlamys debaryana]|uniref:NYN domain-containing protein n=1 Tax=Edaphochlamys debaryana TaxID=47281 RepID=A0A835XSS6_9CHLO|nr:hypothetical protein HYH03_015070 [Edaphochlamys debaryana]|eukprot:KAG2486245.1 hypothetical protein HYH03_015070 [Edaphochlamys debaryana]